MVANGNGTCIVLSYTRFKMRIVAIRLQLYLTNNDIFAAFKACYGGEKCNQLCIWTVENEKKRLKSWFIGK